MPGKYYIKCRTIARKWRDSAFCLTACLLLMLPFLSSAFADTDEMDIVPRIFGPHFEGTEGEIQTIIDQLSKQLTSDPYGAKLYYYLARGYVKQGWHGKAAQYMSQWIKFSNSDVVMRGFHAFIVDEKNDKVLVIDTNTKQVVREIDVGWFPRRIIPTPGEGQLYVTNALSNNVSAIDAEKIAVTKTIKTGRMPWNGKSSPQGDRVYVTNLKSDNVSVIDTKTDAVLETVNVGQGPWGIAVSPDGHKLYISNQDSKNIQVFDTGSYSIVDVIDIGTHPRDIALAPDEKKLYAIDEDIANDEIEIYVIDLEDAQVVKSLNVPSIDDPLLSRVEGMSLEDKLELIGYIAKSDKGNEGHITKPQMESIPRLTFSLRSLDSSARSVSAKGASPEPAKPPVGGPAPLTKPQPSMEAPVKSSTASDGSPLPLHEQETKLGQAKSSMDDPAVLTKPEPYVSVFPASDRKALSLRKPRPASKPAELSVEAPAALAETKPATEVYAAVPAPLIREIPSPHKPESVSKPTELPVDDSAALTKPKSATEAYAKVPPASIREIPSLHKSESVSKPTELPVDDSTAMTKPEPATEVYAKVPSASGDKPLPEQESKPVVESGAAESQEAPEREKRVRRFIVVVSHDTLWHLSIKNYGVVNHSIIKAIQKANPGIKNVDKIYVGQKIKFPDLGNLGKAVIVKPNDNLFRLALNNYGTVSKKIYAAILKANPRIRHIDRIYIGQMIILPALPDTASKTHA